MEYTGQKNRNIAAIIASVIIAVGTFLPFIRLSFLGMSRTISLSESKYGWIFYLIAVIGFIAGLLDIGWLMILSGGSAMAATFIIYSNVNNIDTGDEFSNAFASSIIQRDTGFYVILVGAIILLIAILLKKKN